ncbi:hypothetical protein [Pseudophaeobacter sp.]|uniref:hypothetical protein n=1 Tax=Pseudophaeobacter sp. TaxID=1971739 RepID=UPI003297AB0F
MLRDFARKPERSRGALLGWQKHTRQAKGIDRLADLITADLDDPTVSFMVTDVTDLPLADAPIWAIVGLWLLAARLKKMTGQSSASASASASAPRYARSRARTASL